MALLPTPPPSFEQIAAMKQRLKDCQSIAGCLSILGETANPWHQVMVTPELNGCTLRYDEINSDLSILVIECGEERCVLHHMAYPDPKIAQGDFNVMAQSRALRATALQGIIEHWYTFVGAEELMRQAVNRVPAAVMGAPDVFRGTFPLLFDAVQGGA